MSHLPESRIVLAEYWNSLHFTAQFEENARDRQTEIGTIDLGTTETRFVTDDIN